MISGMTTYPEARERFEGAVILAFPVRCRATIPRRVRKIRGGGPLPSIRPVVSPYGELPALSMRQDTLEEEILELWEG